MNIEELKLVLETVNGIAGNASDVAIWWVVLNYGGNLLVSLVWAICAPLALVLTVRSLVGLSTWADAGKSVARAWGASSTTYGTDYGGSDEAIQKAIAAAKDRK